MPRLLPDAGVTVMGAIAGTSGAVLNPGGDAVVRQSPGVIFDGTQYNGRNTGLTDVNQQSQQSGDFVGQMNEQSKQARRDQFSNFGQDLGQGIASIGQKPQQNQPDVFTPSQLLFYGG